MDQATFPRRLQPGQQLIALLGRQAFTLEVGGHRLPQGIHRREEQVEEIRCRRRPLGTSTLLRAGKLRAQLSPLNGTQDVLQPVCDGFDVSQVHRPSGPLEVVGGAEEVRQQQLTIPLGRALFQGQQALVERAQMFLQLGLEGDHQLVFQFFTPIHLSAFHAMRVCTAPRWW